MVKLFTIMDKILRISKKEFEYRLKIRTAIAQILALVTYYFSFGVYETVMFIISGYNLLNLKLMILNYSGAFCLVLSTTLFIFHQSFELFFLMDVASITVAAIGIHYFLRGLNTIAIETFFLIIFFGMTCQVKAYYMYVVYVVCVSFVVFGFDIMYPSEIIDVKTSTILKGINSLMTWISIVVIFSIDIIENNKNTKLLEETARAIGKLSLDSKHIKNLKEMKDSDCTRILKLMKTIVKNMELYFAYLPSSLKPNEKEVEEEYSEDTGSVSSSSSHVSETYSDSVSTVSSNSTLLKLKRRNKMELRSDLMKSSLTKEFVSLLIIDFPYLTNLEKALEKSPGELKNYINMHSQYIDLVQTNVKRRGGMVYSFKRSKVFAVFNSKLKKTVTKHCEEAVNAAIQIEKQIKEIIKKIHNDHDVDNRDLYTDKEIEEFRTLGSKILVIADSVAIGNIGSNEFRSFEILGNAMNYYGKMFNLMDTLKCNEIFLNDACKDKVNFKFRTKAVGLIDEIKITQKKETKEEEKEKKEEEKKENENGFLIYKLASKESTKKTDDTKPSEWLYEISAHLTGTNIYENFNNAWKSYKERNYTACKDHLIAHLESNKIDHDFNYLIGKLKDEHEMEVVF